MSRKQRLIRQKNDDFQAAIVSRDLPYHWDFTVYKNKIEEAPLNFDIKTRKKKAPLNFD
jgi:hypothetical protein